MSPFQKSTNLSALSFYKKDISCHKQWYQERKKAKGLEKKLSNKDKEKFMKEMEGKTCLITGATSGIGSSAALKLSDMGADICFIARSQEKAKNLGEKIFKISGKEPLSLLLNFFSNPFAFF